jgi:RHO1 GDP-GTP exchange protein 1/2
MDSVFRMLEPVVGKINERARAAGALARFGIGTQRSEWFRTYRVGHLV